MKHCTKVLIELTTSMDLGDVKREDLGELDDVALAKTVEETLDTAFGGQADFEDGSLHYTVKVIRNEVM